MTRKAQQLLPSVLAIILWLFPPAVLAAQPDSADGDPLLRFVVQLGDPDFQQREQATRQLWKADLAAEEILREAAKFEDAEISSRARAILLDFQWGIRADLPESVLPLMRSYRKAKPNERQAAVEALAKLADPHAALAIARLAAVEPSADRLRRHALFGESVALAADRAARLAAIDAPAGQIEQTLQLTLESPHPDEACSVWPAWAVVSGKADHVAGLLEKFSRDPRWPGNATRALVLVKRAAGDFDSAIRMADELVDSDRTDCLLVEHGQWRRLAERFAPDRVQLGIPSLVAFAANIQSRAGASEAADKLASTLAEGAHGEGHSPVAAIQAIFATGRVDQAIELLDRLDDPAIRFQALYLRQDYGAAIRTAEQLLSGRSHSKEERAYIQTTLARLLILTGNQKRGRESFSAIQADALGRKDAKLFYRIVATLSLLEHREDALEIAQDAAEHIPTPEFQGTMLDALFGDRADDARALQRLVTTSGSFREQLAALDRLFTERATPEQLDRLAARAATAEGPLRVAVAGILRSQGRPQDATRLLLDAVKAPGEQGTRAAELGDELVRLQQWSAAASAYRAAFAARPMAAFAIFAGVCERNAGRAEQAREWLDRGSRIILGDAEQRINVAKSLLRAGFDDQAEAQLRIAARTSDYATLAPMAAMKELALVEYRRGNYAAAAQQIEQSVLLRLRLDLLTDEILAIADLHMMHRFQALALIKEGKGIDAMRHVEICLKLLPADVNLPIDAIPLMRKAAMGPQAADLLKQSVAAQEELCRKYPQSSTMHNGLAWLLVRLRTDLDSALLHALRARELSPHSLAIADTVAEVYFQKGDRPRAMELVDECIRRQPDNRRHWLVRQRFEKTGPETEPPAEE